MGMTSFNRMRRRQLKEADRAETAGEELSALSFPELRAEAKRLEIAGYGKMTAAQLVAAVAAARTEADG